MQKSEGNVGVKSRLVNLDLLRLFAIVLVLGRHMSDPPATSSLAMKSILGTWKRGGWIGVDLFFVLSGFLVSGLLFAEYKSRGRLSIVRFYTRRGWKIYPPFFLLIAVTVIIVKFVNGNPISQRDTLSELLFVQNYVGHLWNHTWSLAVEEHFYLLLPLVLAIILKLNRNSSMPLKPVLAVAILVATGSLLLRILNWHYRSVYNDYTHLFPTHLRLDSLLFGVVIAYAYHFHSNHFLDRFTPWRWYLIVVGGLLLVPAFIPQLEAGYFICTLGLTVFYLGSGMLLIGALACRHSRNPLVSLLATVGACSYSIYLWHMAVSRRGIPLAERVCGTSLGFEAQTLLYLIGSLVFGVMMAKLVEVPVLRLRDRWFPPRAEAVLEKKR